MVRSLKREPTRNCLRGAHYSRYFDQQADSTGANESSESEVEPIDTPATSKSLERWVTEGWYADRQWTRWLLPGWVFRGITSLRKFWLREWSYQSSVPVIVVGNLTVGGTGKTPVVAGLVSRLRACGKRPGIVSRGHLGSKTGLLAWPPRKQQPVRSETRWRCSNVRRSHRNWQE